MAIEKGSAVVVTSSADGAFAEFVGQTGTVSRMVEGFEVPRTGEVYPPLFEVKFSPGKVGIFLPEEIEQQS